MKKLNNKLCGFFLFFGMALFGEEMSLSNDSICVGEPIFVSVGFAIVKVVPEHKLSINGTDVLLSNPMAAFFIENAVHVKQDRKQVLSYSLLLLLDEKGDIFFKKPGEYVISFVVGDKSIEKKLIIRDIPADEGQAFEDYEKLVHFIPAFIFGEWDAEAFSAAKEMVIMHPKSRYSKLPALYYISMSNSSAMQQIVVEEKIDIGDKIDIDDFNKKRIAIYEANLKLFASFDFSNDSIINEKADLVFLHNRLLKISATGNIPPQDEINVMTQKLDKIIQSSKFKRYIEDANAMKSMIAEMSASVRDKKP